MNINPVSSQKYVPSKQAVPDAGPQRTAPQSSIAQPENRDVEQPPFLFPEENVTGNPELASSYRVTDGNIRYTVRCGRAATLIVRENISVDSATYETGDRQSYMISDSGSISFSQGGGCWNGSCLSQVTRHTFNPGNTLTIPGNDFNPNQQVITYERLKGQACEIIHNLIDRRLPNSIRIQLMRAQSVIENH